MNWTRTEWLRTSWLRPRSPPLSQRYFWCASLAILPRPKAPVDHRHAVVALRRLLRPGAVGVINTVFLAAVPVYS